MSFELCCKIIKWHESVKLVTRVFLKMLSIGSIVTLTVFFSALDARENKSLCWDKYLSLKTGLCYIMLSAMVRF